MYRFPFTVLLFREKKISKVFADFEYKGRFSPTCNLMQVLYSAQHRSEYIISNNNTDVAPILPYQEKIFQGQ